MDYRPWFETMLNGTCSNFLRTPTKTVYTSIYLERTIDSGGSWFFYILWVGVSMNGHLFMVMGFEIFSVGIWGKEGWLVVWKKKSNVQWYSWMKSCDFHGMRLTVFFGPRFSSLSQLAAHCKVYKPLKIINQRCTVAISNK